MATAVSPVITAEQLRQHWQGHRRLTRRVLDAFPAEQLNRFSVGGMRPFGALAQELLAMAVPTLVGMTTGKWEVSFAQQPAEKAALLAEWDRQTQEIDTLFARIRPEAWQETMNAFGYFEGPAIDILLYIIDNEIHHRAQGYVYLRALGVEPPQFPDRS